MEASWFPFRSFLKQSAPAQFNDLNGPCSDLKMALAEEKLQQPVPPALKALYHINDGQKGQGPGIFPSEETSCRFLPVVEAAYLWESFKNTEDLDVFDINLIPFAHDGVFDAYCLHAGSGSVLFIQTGGPDPFLPRVWQTTRLEVNSSLEEFLHEMLTRITNPRDYSVFMQDKALEGKTKDARMHAVDYLGKRKDPGARDTLLKVLQEDPHASVRFSAVLALSKIGGDTALQGLLAAIEQDPDSGVRIECVRMLYQHKHPNLAAVIVALLQKESDFWVRYDAAKILGKLTKKSPVPAAVVIPIVARDLDSLEDTNYLKFELAIALFRLEGPEGTGKKVLDRLKNAGVLPDYQVTKLNKALGIDNAKYIKK